MSLANRHRSARYYSEYRSTAQFDSVLSLDNCAFTFQPMVTFEQLGRHGEFGNQLFQIAATTAYAKRFQIPAVFPRWECQRSGTHYAPFFERPIGVGLQQEFRIEHRVIEKRIAFDPLPFWKNATLQGYFQSEKYFIDYAKEIRDLFSFKSAVEERWVSPFRHLFTPDSVGVHIRTYSRAGLDSPEVHGSLLKRGEYFAHAMELFGSGTKFYIFSDNLAECRKYFTGPNHYFVTTGSAIGDFLVLKRCSHLIISNSTFGWWAAWLGEKTGRRIIAPAKWFANEEEKYLNPDIVPERWETLH